MNRRTKVRFPIFGGYEVRVIVARDIARTGKKLGVDLSDAEGAWISEEMMGWIVLGENPTEQTIAHEASHAIRSMFASVGARTDNETYAYHLGYLVGRIHKFLKRRA